jgi:hypothetical protein
MNKDYDKGFVCDCCGSYVRRYTRSFNSNMALALLLLYKFNIRGFVKVEDFLIQQGRKRCGDFSYLVHYGFLEKQIGKRNDGSNRNGFYKITGRGLMFCEGKLTAHEKFMILNNKFEGFKGKELSIKEVLGKKFNYDELMGTFMPKTEKQHSQLKQASLL